MAIALQAEEPEPAAVAGPVAADHRVRHGGAGHRRRGDAEAERRAQVPADDEHADPVERRRHDLPATRPLAREQRGGDGAGARDAGDVVAHRPALEGWIGGRRRQGRRNPRARPEGADVVSRPVALRPLGAVAGDAGVDEPRVALGEALGVEAEAREHDGAQVGDEHVGTIDEAERDVASRFLREVERDAPLAAVVELEGRIGRHLEAGGAEEEPAERVAVGRLDLDHVGAPVGQDAGRRRARHPEGELDDPDALHGACHERSPQAKAAARSASTSATCFGAAAERTSAPVSVTRTSSSMRMPMPRNASGTSSASAGM